MRAIYLLIILNVLFGLPRYAIENASSCMNCHVNPSGGGMRNDYGSNIYALDELPLERFVKKGDDSWDGYITDHLQIGGDFRIQNFNDGEESKTFPMQFDLYANLKISKDTDIYMKVDMGPYANNEFFVLFKNIFKRSWIKIGKSSPAYGLRLDDHTSFIRGGNVSSLTDDSDLDKGLFFNPQIVGIPISIETGVVLTDGIQLNLGLSSGFINDPTIAQEKEMVNYSTSLNFKKRINNFKLLSGFSYMEELDINSMSLFGGFAINKLTFSYELDKTNNWIESNESIASYAQIVFKPMQGLHLIAKYDSFDKDIDFATGSIDRYSVGFEIYPLNILEIKFQIRKHESEDYPDLDNECLVQVHTWF